MRETVYERAEKWAKEVWTETFKPMIILTWVAAATALSFAAILRLKDLVYYGGLTACVALLITVIYGSVGLLVLVSAKVVDFFNESEEKK